MRAAVMLTLTWMPATCLAEEPKPDPTLERSRLVLSAARLHREAAQSRERGKSAEVVAKLREALGIHRQLYPVATHPDGHVDLATSLANLGVALRVAGDPAAALPHGRESLEMHRRLFPASRYPAGHARIADCLNILGNLLGSLGRSEEAVIHLRECVEMSRKLYPASKFPDGHEQIAIGLSNLGETYREMGMAEAAVDHVTRSRDMFARLFPLERFPDGHPHLATMTNNLSAAMKLAGRADRAAELSRQAVEMDRRLFPATKHPDGHPQLATSLNNLGSALEAAGRFEEAIAPYQESLAMRRRLYPAASFPAGHPHLVVALNNLAGSEVQAGRVREAAEHFSECVGMCRTLFPLDRFPDGHAYLAGSINNLGRALDLSGRAVEAADRYREALTMLRRLYPPSRNPDGHPDIATSLGSLGTQALAAGRIDDAERALRESLDMRRRLFPATRHPDGHPQIAQALNSFACAIQAQGRANEAADLQRQALEMQRRVLRRELLWAPESSAFERVAAEPLVRDAYLSATRGPGRDAAADYAVVAPSRAVAMRLLDRRHADARASGPAIAAKRDELRGVRRRIDQLVQDQRVPAADRDRLLGEHADRADRLERELAAAIPAMKRWEELDALGSEALGGALPKGAAFIDLIRHVRFEFGTFGNRRTGSYVAFVLANGQPVRRVELGESAPIDAAVRAWRAAIDTGRDTRSKFAEAPLGVIQGSMEPAPAITRLLWEPLAKHIPPGTTTLYLAPDGDLARVPWAAIPVGGGRVLLEDMAVAQVPHGTFLLDHLKFPRTFAGADSLFAVGGLDYGTSIWPKLPGTTLEMDFVVALARGERYAASGEIATSAKVIERLPKARYAHFATHGEFKAEELAKERRRAAAAVAGPIADQVPRVAAKNPLGFVGLVLSGGEVVSGLSILDLDLENLRLVTLSACETGLGEFTAGEGVQGLQRAFHASACKWCQYKGPQARACRGCSAPSTPQAAPMWWRRSGR